MSKEVTPAVEAPEEAVAAEPVDLDANPVDGTLASTDAGFVAKAEEAPAEEPAAEAEPAAEEPEPEQADPEQADPEGQETQGDNHDAAVWGDTGSSIGNSVLGMLQESGISTEDAKALMYDAVMEGDVTKIDVDALAEKVGKNAANIIMSGTKTFIAESEAKTASIVEEVHSAVGGKDNWEAASAWAASNIPEDTLAEYRPMIDKGGAAARFAAQEILAAYNADGNNSTLAPTTPRAEPTSVSPPASTATTRAEYFAALEKAHRRGASQKEIAVIQADRNRGRAKGI